jgi:hypothetical protein
MLQYASHRSNHCLHGVIWVRLSIDECPLQAGCMETVHSVCASHVCVPSTFQEHQLRCTGFSDYYHVLRAMSYEWTWTLSLTC